MRQTRDNASVVGTKRVTCGRNDFIVNNVRRFFITSLFNCPRQTYASSITFNEILSYRISKGRTRQPQIASLKCTSVILRAMQIMYIILYCFRNIFNEMFVATPVPRIEW